MGRRSSVIVLVLTLLTSAVMGASVGWSEVPTVSDTLKVLSLEDCIAIALERNQSVQIAKARIDEASEKRREAFGSYLPSASAIFSYTRLSEVPTLDMTTMLLEPEGGVGSLVRFYGFDTFHYKMGEENNYKLSISVSQPVFTWGRIRSQNRIALLEWELAQEQYRQARLDITFAVKQAFYSVLLTREFRDIAEEAVWAIERHYEVAQALYEEGKVSALDVSRVKVQLVNARTQEIKAANAVKLALKALYNLIDAPEGADWQIRGELSFEPIRMTAEVAFQEALENRPELRQLALRRGIVDELLRLARAETKPTLAFAASYDYSRPFYFSDDWKGSWNAGLYLSFPFFKGFSDKARAGQAQSQLKQIELADEQLRMGMRLEIEKILLSLEEAAERVAAQQENVEVARQNLEIIQKRYQEGLASDLDVTDTRLGLTQAETEYAQALFDYVIALAELERAIGR